MAPGAVYSPCLQPQHIPGAALPQVSRHTQGKALPSPGMEQGTAAVTAPGDLHQMLPCQVDVLQVQEDMAKLPSQRIPVCAQTDPLEPQGAVDAVKPETGLSDTVRCIFSAGRRRLFPEEKRSFPSILGSLSSPADSVIYDVT